MPNPKNNPAERLSGISYTTLDRGLGASYLNSNSELCNPADSGRLALVLGAPEGILSIP